MVETLGRKQLERKRIEDGERSMASVPNYRNEVELREARAFKEAAARLAALSAAGGGGGVGEAGWAAERSLARYWKWAQAGELLFVALYVPTGYADRALRWEALEEEDDGGAGEGPTLLVQAEDSFPLIRRRLHGPLAHGSPIEALLSEDNRLLALTLRKGGARPARRWPRLFAGDALGHRCLVPPYTLAEGDNDTLLELPLPAGCEAAAVAVSISRTRLDVDLGRSSPRLERLFWQDPEAILAHSAAIDLVEPEACSWAVVEAAAEAAAAMDGCEEEEAPAAAAARRRTLQIHLAKPAVSEEKLRYSRGVRDDNRTAGRQANPAAPGARYFECDADTFGLEDVLSALCFDAAGAAYVAPKPAQQYGPERAAAFWASSEAQLPKAAREQLRMLQQARGEAEGARAPPLAAAGLTASRLRA